MATCAENNHLSRAILMSQSHGQIDARRESLQTFDSDLVIGLHLVVGGGVCKCECEHALFLQVGLCVMERGGVRYWDVHLTSATYLMNTSEAADDDGESTQIPRLKGGMLTRGTFTIVVVTNDNPLDTVIAVVGCDSGNASPFARYVVLDVVGFAVCSVDGTNQAVF